MGLLSETARLKESEIAERTTSNVETTGSEITEQWLDNSLPFVRVKPYRVTPRQIVHQHAGVYVFLFGMESGRLTIPIQPGY